MSRAYTVSTPAEIRRYINAALAHPDHTEVLPFAPGGNAQAILNEIWKVLDSPALPNAANGPSFGAYRNHLRRLSLKMASQFDIFPELLILKGVTCIDTQQHGAGGFADVFLGVYRGTSVGLKRLRIYLMMSSTQKEVLKKAFYRESLLWKNLDHNHILPFLGVSEDVFAGTVCMVIPWMVNGNLRHFIEEQVNSGRLIGLAFEQAIVEWLSQTADGLAYLHGEGVVHGDLHAGNLLVDQNGSVRLTDFGMSLISEGTAYNYGSQHGGGAIRWSAPELFDPEEFGLESSRPTFQSDIYAFACIAIELYTGKPPFATLTDRQVPLRVVRGDRPPRPILPNGQAISEVIWSVMQSCWDRSMKLRSPATVLAGRLAKVPQKKDAGYFEKYIQTIQSMVRAKLPSQRDARVQWLEDALLRTAYFYRNNGVVESLSWVLVPKKTEDDVFVPKATVTVPDLSAVKWFIARHWSPSPLALLPTIVPFNPVYGSADDPYGFVKMRRMRDGGPFEILVASPEHIQWVTVSGAFVPQALPRRPVNVNDGTSAPSGPAPWIMRLPPDIATHTYFALRCTTRSVTLETSTFEAYDGANGDAITKYEILCHAT